MSGPVRFKATTEVAVTAASALFNYPDNNNSTTPVVLRLVSDIGVHLKWGNKGSSTTATQSDGFIPAGTVEYITMGHNDEIAIISATGTPTGTAWFTTT